MRGGNGIVFAVIAMAEAVKNNQNQWLGRAHNGLKT